MRIPRTPCPGRLRGILLASVLVLPALLVVLGRAGLRD